MIRRRGGKTPALAAFAAVLAAFAPRGAPAQSAVPLLVTVSRYQFSPGGPEGPPLRLNAGITYRITFHSTDVEHGISAVTLLGISEQVISPGFDSVVTVAPTLAQRGRYNFACTRVCGSGHGGMYGSIEVVGVEDGDVLVLGDGRFAVEATFRTSAGQIGTARPVPLTDDSGYFWFFDAANVEIVVKVLDGCATNGRFWVFLSGLTNQEVLLSVTDNRTGERRIYENPQGEPFAPVQDTAAFASCP